MDLVTRAMQDGLNQYAPMAGVLELREQIALKAKNLYQCNVEPVTEVTITSGATEAIFVAVQAIARRDSEVIIFDPAYDSYEPAITLAGARAIHVPLQLPDFSVDWQLVRDSINARTSLIIINSPHNPTGAVLTAADLHTLAELTRDTNIVILADEVYEHMVFDGIPHQSLLGHEELARRAFVVFSFGKTYHATGWKVAYCVAPQKLSEELRKVHQYVTFCTNTPIQHALATYMRTSPDHYHGLADFYQHKRDAFIRAMQASPFKLIPTRGTYFQLADYSDISRMDDVAFAHFLTREVGVAAIPISVFCEQPPATRMIRFCFAKDERTLELAAAKLCDLQPLLALNT